MTELATSNPWVLALIAFFLGILLGVIGANLFERRKNSGRTVVDVQREMDEYKEEVGKHFATTSELFRDMTEKYRDVYNHLATGSQELCEDSLQLARLEYAQNASLEVSDEIDSDQESPEDEPVQVSEQSAENLVDEDSGQDAAAPDPDSQSSDAPERDDPPLRA